MPTPLLQLGCIEKQFAGVRALKSISLAVEAGEVVGLIGENGAGKSTLIKILSGVYPPDSGSIIWQGGEVRFGSPHEAIATGMATIHQELAYCGHLSVAENMFLSEPWPRRPWGGIDWAVLHTLAAERLARFQLDIPTHRFLMELSPAQKQEVAIARALSQDARLLILDEPTASLSEPDVQRLFAHLQRLRREGVAMIYVSHRLDEILQLADRVAVLRDGELISVYPTAQATVLRMVKDMVGRPLEQVYPHTRPAERGEVLIELDKVGRAEMFHGISLRVHAGEIVGLAGLVGAGRSELARAIYGLYPIDSGAMRLRGQPWKPTAPHESIARGLVYLPEERKRQGLVLEHAVGDSISIGFSDLLARWGLISKTREGQQICHAMKAYDVRARGPAQAIGNLSGGNQQKAMLARWLERGPSVLLLDEPTRGVDVGAKAEIHGLIDRLAAQEKGVLLISSDLPEVLGLSDRVLVMHEGTISSELIGSSRTQENVLLAASGLSAS